MAVRFEYRFYDYEQNLFKVNIYRHAYSDSVYTIQEADADPVSIRHSGGDKNSMEEIVIQGQSLEFNFYLPRADIDNIDYIFESKYQDYVLEYLDGSDNLIFKGYVKPENLTKRYETKPPYIEIALSANDALVDLSEFDFRDANDDLILGRKKILEIIKQALVPIAGNVLNFPFKIQLNTYETNVMLSTECALEKLYIEARAFLNGDLTDDDPIDCYSVLIQALKGWSCVLRQEGEYYIITNPHELDSYEYLFTWDLVFQSRTATNNLLDFSLKKFQPYIEEQKIHPIRKATITHKYDVVSNEFLPSDSWNEWDFNQFTNTTIDADNTSKIQVYSDYQLANVTPEPYFTLTSAVNIAKISSNDYLVLSFDYTIDSFTSALNSGCQLFFKIEFKRPNGDWSTPTYHEIDLRVREKVISFSTDKNTDLIVSETGDYNVKVTVFVKKGYYENMYLTLENPSIEIMPLSVAFEDARGRGQSGSRGRGTRGEVSQRTGYSGRNQGRRTATNVRWGNRPGREGASIEDTDYILEQENGYEQFFGELWFADVRDYANARENVSLLNVFYTVTDAFTRNWRSYGHTEDASFIFIYAKNIINNRQVYKNYLRFKVYDRNHEVSLSNILVIESKNYFIIEYDRHYKEGYVDLALIEIKTNQLSFTTDDVIEEDLHNIPGTDKPSNPYELNGIDQSTHNFGVGDIIRYDYAAKEYVKAQADSVDHAKAIGIVSEVLDNNQFKFVSDDYVRGDSALYQTLKTNYDLEEGEYYFLSPDTPGAIVKSADLTANNVEQCIGYVTTKGLKVQINARKIEPTLPTFPRAAKTTIVQGENSIDFDTAFPNGTIYILWTYTYDANNFQVGSYIIEESDGTDGTETGFTIYAAKACNLKYIATPIK